MFALRLIPLLAFAVVACLMCAYTEHADARGRGDHCSPSHCAPGYCGPNGCQLSQEKCACDCPKCQCNTHRYKASGSKGGPVRKAARAAKAPLRFVAKVFKFRPFKALRRCRG
jgi:predicted nucleic-acid-binding Zn-ribbon protein